MPGGGDEGGSSGLQDWALLANGAQVGADAVSFTEEASDRSSLHTWDLKSASDFSAGEMAPHSLVPPAAAAREKTDERWRRQRRLYFEVGRVAAAAKLQRGSQTATTRERAAGESRNLSRPWRRIREEGGRKEGREQMS